MMNYQELLHSPIAPSQVAPLIEKASQCMVPVLIQGEPGTGKEIVAKMIHHAGAWKSYRFFKIDCKLLSGDDLRDQLDRLLMELRDGMSPGTFYLEEVEYLAPMNQLRLLEIMEDGIFQHGMEKRTVPYWRFIASSSVSIHEKVIQGKFSKDLFQRLNTLAISLLPLRERVEEIPAISQYILSEYSKKMKIKKVGISEHVQQLLKSYWWPGNLIELEQVIIRSALFSEGETLSEKDLYFETDPSINSFASFIKKAEARHPEPSQNDRPNEQPIPSLSLFLIELVHRIKNPLVSIKTFTQLLREKFNDAEFRDYFYRIVGEDIEKIDSLLNTLLNYIKINTPLEKTNTVHNLLEELFKNYETLLGEKKIKLFKKYEKGLPETIVDNEPLRYILNSILQYALSGTPPHGSIGFLTKSIDISKETTDTRTSFQEGERVVEILIVFTGFKKPMDPFENILGVSPLPQEGEAFDLELRLTKDIIQKKGGVMKVEANEKNLRTLISVRFPIERRKVFSYPSNHA
jgi:hypothetical protein